MKERINNAIESIRKLTLASDSAIESSFPSLFRLQREYDTLSSDEFKRIIEQDYVRDLHKVNPYGNAEVAAWNHYVGYTPEQLQKDLLDEHTKKKSEQNARESLKKSAEESAKKLKETSIFSDKVKNGEPLSEVEIDRIADILNRDKKEVARVVSPLPKATVSDAEKQKHEETSIFSDKVKNGEPLSEVEIDRIADILNRDKKEVARVVSPLPKATVSDAEKQKHDTISSINENLRNNPLSPQQKETISSALRAGPAGLADREQYFSIARDLNEFVSKENQKADFNAEKAKNIPPENESDQEKSDRLDAEKKKEEDERKANPQYETEWGEKNENGKSSDDWANGQDQFTGGPKWQSQAARSIARRAFRESQTKYEPYKGNRTAALTPLQQIAKERIFDTLENPELSKLSTGARNKTTELANKRSIDNIQDYMNPYQEAAVDALQKRMHRSLKETLPLIDSNFIAKGAYRSRGRQDARQKALRGMNEAFAHEAGNMMNQGYMHAHGAAAHDMERQAVAAREMQNLKSTEEEAGVKNAHLLDTIGTREQQLDQTKKNMEYEDFLKQKNYYPEQTGRLHEIVRGLPINYQTTTTTPSAAQASPYSQLAGGLQSVFASYHDQKGRGHKKGGIVKRLATGGQVTSQAPNPGQDYQNRLQMAAQQLEGNNSNPMWRLLANMGAHVAANTKQNNVMSAIGEAMPSAIAGHRESMAHSEERKAQAQNLMHLIEGSRRYEDEQSYNRKLNKQKMDLERERFNWQQKQKKKNPILERAYGIAVANTIEKGEESEKIIPLLDRIKYNSDKVGKTDIGGKFSYPYAAVGIGDMFRKKEEELLPFYQQMNADIADLQSYYTNQNKGNPSDYDAKIALARLPQDTMSPEARTMLINDAKKYAERQKEKAAFTIDMLSKNADLSQINQMWNQYTEQNPLFKESEVKNLSESKSEIEGKDKVNSYDLPYKNTKEIPTEILRKLKAKG